MRRTLTPIDDGQSAKITLPKGDLEMDGVVAEDGSVERRPVDIRKKGPGRYEVVILDEELTPLEELADAEAAQSEPADD